MFAQRSYEEEKTVSEGSEEDDDYVPYVPVKIRKQQMVSCSTLNQCFDSVVKIMPTMFQPPFNHVLLNIFLYIGTEKVCLVHSFLGPAIIVKIMYRFFVPFSHWRLKCFYTAAKNVTSTRKGSGGGLEGQRWGAEGWGWRSRSTLQYQSSRSASAPQGKSWRCVDSSYTPLQPICYCYYTGR